MDIDPFVDDLSIAMVAFPNTFPEDQPRKKLNFSFR
jgi:hypothetical protein